MSIQEEQHLQTVRGLVADLPPQDRIRVQTCAAQLRSAITHYGKHGAMALALIGAEAQADRIDFGGPTHG